MGKDNEIKMVDFGAEIPEQVNILVDLAAKFGSGQWPNAEGVYAPRPTKKDVVGYLLHKGAEKMLDDMGLMEVAVRTVESMTSSDYKTDLYGAKIEASNEPVEDASDILGGIESTKS